MTEPQRLGKYRLLRRIAVGGVAEVYLAVAEGTAGFEKRVVVKRLQPARARDAGVVAMFLDEARLMALFHHPHVAEVYDIGKEGDECFFAMEHVDGCDLRDLLDAAPAEALPLPAALAITRAVALGLAHAHEQTDRAGVPLGVVHRDVSPSNVLLGRRGEVKLIDFGVAKWTAQRSHTEHGTLKGKFAYMSPEQCRAEPLDGRSDLFALGVLLYELCTGRRPFAADSDFELLSAIVRGAFVPPEVHAPDLPAGLSALITRALALAPRERHPGAAAFVEALDAAAAAAGITPAANEVARLLEARQVRRAATPHEGAGAGAGGERPAALDRTATDWSTPPPALAAGPALAERRGTRRRIALAVGGAAVVVGALAMAGLGGGLRARQDEAAVAGASRPRALSPASAPAAAPRPTPTPADAAPALAAGRPAMQVAPARPPAVRRAPRRASPENVGAGTAPDASTAPPPAAPPPVQPAPKVWDPDSPTPP